MPELPDVEIFRKRFARAAKGRTLDKVEIFEKRMLRGTTPSELIHALAGRQVVDTMRHGKHLLTRLDSGTIIELHFGMSGTLEIVPKENGLPKYTVMSLTLDNGGKVAITSQRKLGYIALARSIEEVIRSRELGPDALDPALDGNALRERLGSARGTLKSALMDQSKLAGIGNVYSDEILFRAHLHPKLRIGDLKPQDFDRLLDAIRSVLREAIKLEIPAEGAEGRAPDDWLLAHRGEGGRCPRCGGRLGTLKVSGRTAYYCPSCQGSAA